MKHGITLAIALLITGMDAPANEAPLIHAPNELEAIGATCVALAVFAVSRGDSYFKQAVVAKSILNAQAGLPFGSDACDVIADIPQVRDWVFPRQPWQLDNNGWLKAVEVAQVVMSGDYYIPPPCLLSDSFAAAGLAAPAGKELVCEVEGLAFYSPVDALATWQATGGTP